MIPAIVFVVVFCVLESSSLEVKKVTMHGFVLNAKDNKPAADAILKFQYWSHGSIHLWHDVRQVSAKSFYEPKASFNPIYGWFTFDADVGSDLPASAKGVRVVPDPENAEVVFKDVVIHFNQ
ncbi:hypothetical protein DdX_12625 [Ditylenchus destructor]|uniref:Uncharacterized protein n=1 Tax=Ditylenchus destructor TaxID=166010 RepID=A0AAD4MUS2_9BILA|nr:hypothetical protein DdX_12625 [Ditylenchus destructor]